MRYAITRPGESISKLTRRLYESDTTEARKAAEAALRDANPVLEGVGVVPAGLVVEVPEVEDTKVSSEARPPTEVAGAAGLRALRASVPDLQTLLSDAIDRRVNELEDSGRLLEGDDLKRLAADDEEVAAEIGAVKTRSEERLAEVRGIRTEYKAGLRELATDIDDLLGLFG